LSETHLYKETLLIMFRSFTSVCC